MNLDATTQPRACRPITFDPTWNLKPLPDSLKYVFLGSNKSFHAIIAFDLNVDQDDELLKELRRNK